MSLVSHYQAYHTHSPRFRFELMACLSDWLPTSPPLLPSMLHTTCIDITMYMLLSGPAGSLQKYLLDLSLFLCLHCHQPGGHLSSAPFVKKVFCIHLYPSKPFLKIEMKFTLHKINHSKVYNLVHLQCYATITSIQFQNIFITPKENLLSLSSHSLFPLPPAPGSYQSAFCQCVYLL